MARRDVLLTEEQWIKIAPLLPAPQASRKGGPKPIENRPVFEGILWVLRSGARWKDLPERYPAPSTCWRRLRDWDEQGVWLRAGRALLAELDEQDRIDWSEVFADGSFAPAKKGFFTDLREETSNGRPANLEVVTRLQDAGGCRWTRMTLAAFWAAGKVMYLGR